MTRNRDTFTVVYSEQNCTPLEHDAVMFLVLVCLFTNKPVVQMSVSLHT